MSFPRSPEYKGSGVPWLGAVVKQVVIHGPGVSARGG